MYMNNILCFFTKKFGSKIRERTVKGVMDLLLTFMGGKYKLSQKMTKLTLNEPAMRFVFDETNTYNFKQLKFILNWQERF